MNNNCCEETDMLQNKFCVMSGARSAFQSYVAFVFYLIYNFMLICYFFKKITFKLAGSHGILMKFNTQNDEEYTITL